MADGLLKRLELRLRRWMTDRPGGGQPMVVTSPAPVVVDTDAPRIVLLRQDRIGDVLVSIPVLRALRAAFPAATIDMVLSPNNMAAATVVRTWVDNIVTYRKSLAGLVSTIRRLRRGRYDVIIDLMDNPSATSTMLIRHARTRYAVGIDKSNRTAYTHVVPLLERSTVHIVERLSMLLLPFGIDPTTVPLDLAYPLQQQEREAAARAIAADDRPILGVNISGSDDSRRYPVAQWVHVLERFKRTRPTWRVLILSAPADASQQADLAARIDAEQAPTTGSFHAFAAIVQQCSMIVSPDTSVVHLAAAFKRPAVIMYVHNDPGLMPWHPYASPHRALYARSAIAEIRPEDVNDALEALSSSDTTT